MARLAAMGAVFCGQVMAAGVAATAAGQDVPLRPGSSEPACAGDAVPQDTASFTIYLAPPRNAADKPDRSAVYARLVHAVGSAFQPPRAIAMESWPGTFYHGVGQKHDPGAPTSGVGPLTGQVHFKLREGRVRELAWALLPDSRDVTLAIQAAIERADSLQYFAGLRTPSGQPGGTVRLDVTMTAEAPPSASMALMKVRMPYIRIDTPVHIVHIPTPKYPEAAARHGIRGDVALQYVVNENGRVNRSSIRVIDPSYQEFIDAAVDAVAAGQFSPARAGGCAVKSLVRQRIRFRM